jgi:hypothetical protein
VYLLTGIINNFLYQNKIIKGEIIQYDIMPISLKINSLKLDSTLFKVIKNSIGYPIPKGINIEAKNVKKEKISDKIKVLTIPFFLLFKLGKTINKLKGKIIISK